MTATKAGTPTTTRCHRRTDGERQHAGQPGRAVDQFVGVQDVRVRSRVVDVGWVGTGAVTYSVSTAGTAGCSIVGTAPTSPFAPPATSGHPWGDGDEGGDTNYNAVVLGTNVNVDDTKANQVALTISSSASRRSARIFRCRRQVGSGPVRSPIGVDRGTAGCSIVGRSTSVVDRRRRDILWGDGDEGRDTNYNAVSSVEQTVNVDTKANQVALTISSSASKTYGSDLALSTSRWVGTGASPIRCRPRERPVVPSWARPQLLSRRGHILWGDGDETGTPTTTRSVPRSDRERQYEGESALTISSSASKTIWH